VAVERDPRSLCFIFSANAFRAAKRIDNIGLTRGDGVIGALVNSGTAGCPECRTDRSRI